MYYIIDANNLAGEMGLLKEKDFDEKLIETASEFLAGKKHKIILVFDSLDPMGDKYTLGNLRVVYSPKDDYYQSADDKIIELCMEHVKDKRLKHYPLVVVTSDIGIKQSIEKINEKFNFGIKLVKSSDFAGKLAEDLADEDKEDGSRGLEPEEIDKINSDLLRLWK